MARSTTGWRSCARWASRAAALGACRGAGAQRLLSHPARDLPAAADLARDRRGSVPASGLGVGGVSRRGLLRDDRRRPSPGRPRRRDRRAPDVPGGGAAAPSGRQRGGRAAGLREPGFTGARRGGPAAGGTADARTPGDGDPALRRLPLPVPGAHRRRGGRAAYDAEFGGRADAPAFADVASAIRERLASKQLDERIEAWVRELRAGAEIRYNA